MFFWTSYFLETILYKYVGFGAPKRKKNAINISATNSFY